MHVNSALHSDIAMAGFVPFSDSLSLFEFCRIRYTIGSVIKHQNLGIGTIIDISEIKEGVNIITIRFTDDRIDKLPLESVVQKNLIMIGIRSKTNNE